MDPQGQQATNHDNNEMDRNSADSYHFNDTTVKNSSIPISQSVYNRETVHDTTEPDEKAPTDETSSVRLDLDNVTKAQVLAVQTRAQQEQQLQADAAATAASEAVIHSLDSAQPADRLGGGPPVDQDDGPTSPGSSQSVDRPGRESTPAEDTAEEDDTSSVATRL